MLLLKLEIYASSLLKSTDSLHCCAPTVCLEANPAYIYVLRGVMPIQSEGARAILKASSKRQKKMQNNICYI